MFIPALVAGAVLVEHGVSAGIATFLVLYALREIHDRIEEVRDLNKENSNGRES